MDKHSHTIELYGQTFTVRGKREAHLRDAVAALEERLRSLAVATRSADPLRLALMAAVSAEAERLETGSLFAPLVEKAPTVLEWE